MSLDPSKYYQRKAKGVCVRCEAKTCGSSVLCEAHLNYSRSRRKAKAPDDAPWAITSPVEPPREPYKSDVMIPLEPVPTRCPKCSGCLYIAELEWGESVEAKCINCGWRPRQIHANPDPTYGAQLPAVVRV